MGNPVAAEAALRLAGERSLLGAREPWHHRGELGDVAMALVTLCGLDPATARTALEDYGLALALRGRGMPPGMRAQRASAYAAAGVPPAPPAQLTVVPCGRAVELAHGTAQVGVVAFTAESCRVSVRYDEVPSFFAARRRRPAASGPPTLAVADDRGTLTHAHFSGGGGGTGGWQGRWDTQRPLSPATGWLELDGRRVPLGAPPAAARVRVEPLPDADAVHRYLWHRLAAGGPGPSEDHDDEVLDALLAAGALDPEDPELATLAEVATAVLAGPFGHRPTAAPPPPWDRLLSGGRRAAGPAGDVPIGAATPPVDGTVAALFSLRSDPERFTVDAQAVGPGARIHSPFTDELPGVALAWWAEDDRGNAYLGRWDNHGGSPGEVSGDIAFRPALDPAARRLRLLATGLHHRAVVEIDLPRWGQP